MEQSQSKQATINLTLTDYVYEKLKKEADQAGVSLNQLVKGYITSITY